MSGKTIWDPLRRKDVPLTPEERVRQWFIGVMHSDMHVPMHMMMSEVGFKFGDGPVQKDFRADIVVYDRKPAPTMIVECKRPAAELAGQVMEQALRYNAVLNVRHIAVTNGLKTFFVTKGEDGVFRAADKIPDYEEIISQETRK